MEYTNLKNITHFDIFSTFDCGQCFRFERTPDNAVEGVAYGRYIKIEQPEIGTLKILADKGSYESLWKHFLSLDTDYDTVQQSVLSAFGDDSVMKNAMNAGNGIRILRQEPWEALCSFIISQNNNIPRIKGIINNLCRTYGNKITSPDGRDFYTFPDAETVYNAGEDGMAALRTGFRAKYILSAAKAVCTGETDLDYISALPTNEALAELCKLYGVGLKVASCAALFGLGKTDAFPVDVWVKRILAKYYPSGLDLTALGEYAGVAQQYLFYYERYLSGETANA